MYAPRAKRVIFLCMAGGPSHLETLDYKPKLAEMDGQPSDDASSDDASGDPVDEDGVSFLTSFLRGATATVRLVPDPTFDCTDATGKVFDDLNLNGMQDPGEAGIPGARVVTVRGLAATTDAHGRYHITCAITPNESRGSNFALKLDDRTLPSGYRMSTRTVQVKRATRGKALSIATLSTNLAANVVSPANAIVNLAPRWFSFSEPSMQP